MGRPGTTLTGPTLNRSSLQSTPQNRVILPLFSETGWFSRLKRYPSNFGQALVMLADFEGLE